MDGYTGLAADELSRMSAPERAEAMCRMRAEGKSLAQIGQTFGLTRERVRQIIMSAQGPDREAAAEARKRQAVRDKELLREQILDVCRTRPGMSAAEVGQEVGVSAATVRATLGPDAGRVLVSTYKATMTFTDEEILAQIRRAADRAGVPLTVRLYEQVRAEVGGASSPLILQRFKTWREACLAAGVQPGKPLRDSYKRRWSREELVVFVADYLRSEDARGSFADYERWARENDGVPSGQTIRTQLGAWSRAKAEGLSVLASGDN